MNQKVFIEKSDEIINNMGLDELKKCLHNVARKTPENKRERNFRGTPHSEELWRSILAEIRIHMEISLYVALWGPCGEHFLF